MRILLADDNPAFLKAAEHFLRSDSRIRQIHLARSGVEALALADRENPDLVLLDWSLPDLKGLWAALRITGGNETAEVWILAPHDNPEYERAARAAGAEGCLPRLHFTERIGPILQNLQQRIGSRPPQPERPAAAIPGEPPLPGKAGEARRNGPPERGPAGEGPAPDRSRQAAADLERLCSQHMAELARIKEDLGVSPGGPETASGKAKEELFIVCRLGSEWFGLPAGQVARVEKTAAITFLPPSYRPVIGLAAFAGRALPVLGLQENADPPSGTPPESARLVIVRSGRSLAGLQVDGVEGLTPVASSARWPFPWHPSTGPRSYLNGVTRYKDRFIFLLDVDKIMTDLNGVK